MTRCFLLPDTKDIVIIGIDLHKYKITLKVGAKPLLISRLGRYSFACVWLLKVFHKIHLKWIFFLSTEPNSKLIVILTQTQSILYYVLFCGLVMLISIKVDCSSKLRLVNRLESNRYFWSCRAPSESSFLVRLWKYCHRN